jgi:hypothetical protein
MGAIAILSWQRGFFKEAPMRSYLRRFAFALGRCVGSLRRLFKGGILRR